MKRSSVFLLLLTAAAPGNSAADHRALMDEIDGALSLPQGAKPLNAYGRNYALSGQSKVIATFLIPLPPIDVNRFCGVTESVGGHYKTRPCTTDENKERAASDMRNVAAQTPAGKRRWHDSVEDLPSYHDGACMQVNVEYDIKAHRAISVTCNGYA